MKRYLYLFSLVMAVAIAQGAQAQTWSAGSNTGLTFESNSSGRVFGAYYYYDDATGAPVFQIFDGTDNDGTHANGTTYVARNGSPIGSASCTPASLTQASTIRTTFANARQGTLQLGSGAVQELTRTEIQSGYPDPTSGANYITRGWYWDSGCAGQGAHFEVMGDTLFAALFAYEADGTGVWYIATGGLVRNTSNSTSSFTGALMKCSRSNNTVSCPSVGNVTFQFPLNNKAVVTWPNGSTSTLTPFSF